MRNVHIPELTRKKGSYSEKYSFSTQYITAITKRGNRTRITVRDFFFSNIDDILRLPYTDFTTLSFNFFHFFLQPLDSCINMKVNVYSQKFREISKFYLRNLKI